MTSANRTAPWYHRHGFAPLDELLARLRVFPWRRSKHVAADAVTCAAVLWLSYLLRFDFHLPPHELVFALYQTPLVVTVQVAALLACGVYRFIWRYIGIRDLQPFAVAAFTAAVPLVFLRLVLPDTWATWRVPLSVTLLSSILMFWTTLATRVARRVIYEQYQRPRQRGLTEGKVIKPVLLIGAGRAGKAAADELRRRRSADLDVKGFIDDNPSLRYSIIHGLKVLGTTSELPSLVKEYDIDHVVIAMAYASRQDIRRIVRICERIPVRARIIPSLPELLQGNVTVSRIRDVRIDDLLGRAPIHLDKEAARSFIAGKTVLVTGAGGSIGSELARQVLRHEPARLLLAERAEFALFNIHHELVRSNPTAAIVPIVADVASRSRAARIFAEHAPHVVIHAAAHKHVPLMEANPTEAVAKQHPRDTCSRRAGGRGWRRGLRPDLDRQGGPSDIGDGCVEAHGRARHPESERRASDALRRGPVRQCHRVVRLGRADLRGQIDKGGPVTVTHPDMVRYFMTIPEAAQLVLEAAALGRGGEIFVLDMGEPVRILDLAKDLIRLAGLRPFDDIDIVYSGMRPGEKLFEELEMTDEMMSKTRHPKIFIGNIQPSPPDVVARALNRLEAALARGDGDEIKRMLNDAVPEAALAVNRETEPHEASTPLRARAVGSA